VRDPSELYELATDLPIMQRPVLVQALSSFVDAGGAVRIARDHLLETLPNQVVATFDLDQVYDYRSRRPIMDFVEDHWESYEAPSLALHQVKDNKGVPFLLLAGPEPDIQWERFVAAVIQLMDRFDARMSIGLNAIPLAVPHTRPAAVTAHASRRELIEGYEPWISHVRVPASAGHLLEYRLSQRGRDAMGFAAHVPHYIAQNDYPAAAETLLDAVRKVTDLDLPTPDLVRLAEDVRANIDLQVAHSEEAIALVEALEQQYDAFVRGREGESLLSDGQSLPTADELGAELERFLAEQGRGGQGGSLPGPGPTE
jgi:hypothetical protein